MSRVLAHTLCRFFEVVIVVGILGIAVTVQNYLG